MDSGLDCSSRDNKEVVQIEVQIFQIKFSMFSTWQVPSVFKNTLKETIITIK